MVAAGSAAATGLGAMALLAPAPTNASSHREAPYIAGEPRLDNTDVYAFVSPDDADMVTIVANWWPLEEPNGGPNFYKFEPGANYDVNIDNDGNGTPDLTYRWVFRDHYRTTDTFLYNVGPVTSIDDPDLNFYQTYDLYEITEDNQKGSQTRRMIADGKVAPSFVGPASMPEGYEPLRDGAITSIKGGGKSYAGQADDPFFLDLRIFDLLYGGAVEEGSPGFPGAVDFVEDGHDTLAGYNVQTIALQVPAERLALHRDVADNPVIGVWSDTMRPRVEEVGTGAKSGTFKRSKDQAQVSRLGNPLVNEVVIPIRDKDRFNASVPVNDARFLPYVTDPIVPGLVEAIYGVPAPEGPRTDLVEVFLTGVCAVPGCPDTIGDVNLNSQLLNKGVNPKRFVPSEMLRLNMAVPPSAEPNRLGVIGGDVAGFPNGRRLADDVVDIALQVVEGELVGQANDLGDAVSENDKGFSSTFPYVAVPHSDSVNRTDAESQP